MEKKKDIKDKWLHVRMDEAEFNALKKNFGKATETKLSVYARKILLGKPMFAGTKDTGIQEILAVLFRLQKDLNGIGNNYNQMVRKLHISDKVPEVKAWLNEYQDDREAILEAIRTIKDYLRKTSRIWLR